ncbi:MAG: hypothetical protein V2A58_04255 [Planctomycetota bacterium]
MDCLSQEDLVRYACGELEAPEQALASAHMRGCDSCRQELEAIELLARLAANLARRNVSAARVRAIMQKAEELLPLDPAARKEIREEKARKRVVRIAPAPALAACASVALAIAAIAVPAAVRSVATEVPIAEKIDRMLDAGTLTPGAAMQILAHVSCEVPTVEGWKKG